MQSNSWCVPLLLATLIRAYAPLAAHLVRIEHLQSRVLFAAHKSCALYALGCALGSTLSPVYALVRSDGDLLNLHLCFEAAAGSANSVGKQGGRSDKGGAMGIIDAASSDILKRLKMNPRCYIKCTASTAQCMADDDGVADGLHRLSCAPTNRRTTNGHAVKPIPFTCSSGVRGKALHAALGKEAG